MDLISLILAFVIVGVLMWLINTYVPMAQPIKTLLNVAVVVILCLWLVNIFFGPIHIPVGRLR